MINFFRILGCAIYNTLNKILDTDACIFVFIFMMLLYLFAPFGGFASLFIFMLVEKKDRSIGFYVFVVASIIGSILAAIFGDWSIQSLDNDISKGPDPVVVFQMLSSMFAIVVSVFIGVGAKLATLFIQQYGECKRRFFAEKEYE